MKNLTSANPIANLDDYLIMNKDLFNSMINKIDCDCFDLNDTIGFSVDLKGYEINFYGTKENNFSLEISEFGGVVNDSWVTLIPTEKQHAKMDEILAAKFNELNEEDRIQKEHSLEVEEQPYFYLNN